jgi:hypothetical protein
MGNEQVPLAASARPSHERRESSAGRLLWFAAAIVWFAGPIVPFVN